MAWARCIRDGERPAVSALLVRDLGPKILVQAGRSPASPLTCIDCALLLVPSTANRCTAALRSRVLRRSLWQQSVVTVQEGCSRILTLR